MKPLRVLLVEDSVTDAKLVIRELRRTGWDVTSERVETDDAMREALSRGQWDIVISDWSMPLFSAPRALATLADAGLDIPFIIVSGTIGDEIAVEGMRAGARDFMSKDRLARLAPAVDRELREREARASRRQAEARFARLAESGIVGIGFADVHGNVHDANDAYLQMLGYSREDLRAGKLGWARMTPPEWEEVDAAATAQLRTRGVAAPWEKELFHKDGHRVPVLVGVAMLDMPNCIAFVADLTERKRAEAALARSEEELRQSQKMEAVGRLAGGVAHDFNNVLSVILSYATIVSDELAPGDPMRADLAEIRKAADRAAKLTRQLLAFSRRQVLQLRVVDLDDSIKGMEQMLRRLLGEDVELTLSVQGHVAKVRVDPGQIEQVVMNLAVNARDAMPRGGKLLVETANVVLGVGEVPGANPGPHVMLAISDTGTGMDGLTMARIFEPFFTTKGEGKGTGLGLSTVHGIVQQSGGAIRVESQPGVGTIFRIYFVPVTTTEVEVVRATVAPTSGGAETVLLVEDDESLRMLSRKILDKLGYRVLEAQSGGDALLICEQHSGTIDLLLTDVVMPRMSGRQLAERLEPLRPDMRVLYMSGYTDDAVLHHGVQHSEVAFLQKPITPDSLARKVRETLDAPIKRRTRV